MSEQQAVVEEVRSVAAGVVAVSLRATDGSALPSWSPGAHIDVELPNWLRRQYSLCGDPDRLDRYRIAVRRQRLSRGGSEYIHDFLHVGQELTISPPRNNFALVPAAEYLFVAGGIGITPILPMVRRAEAAGASWRLLYAGRTLDAMAFRDELAVHGDRVELVTAARPDLGALVAGLAPDTHVYGCGPEAMLTALDAALGAAAAARLHVEHFRAPHREFGPNTSFTVACHRSGQDLLVAAEDSVLDVLLRAGLPVGVGCREGVCGSCRIDVLAGVPEHRDGLGDPDDARMYPCVSRARTPTLTVDL